MTPERWQQIKTLFDTVIALAENERAAFLERACSDDTTLRGEVESLLRADAKAARVFENLIGKIYESLPAPAIAISVDEGKMAGAYRLEREIGRGGMGVVYLAARADGQFEKRVAIKLIKRGMDSEAILQRFRRERQTLAQLDHPNIARLLDAGMTEEGRPYFIMEYIDGLPIDIYCDAHQLDINARLKLFQNVCAAVQYVHRHATVHRDLKPSNILVTAEGAPKLVDFGIAKLLDPNAAAESRDLTVAGMRLLTLEYASPEQVRGESITFAGDVYSLGVLLYKLLTGHHSYRLAKLSPQEIERVICEQEPERPSAAIHRVALNDDDENEPAISPATVSTARRCNFKQLRRQLAGDLDNIVMKALRKEPAQRYASVEELSEDLRRHLEGQPVLARKNGFWYRGERAIRKQKRRLIYASVITLLVAGGLQIKPWVSAWLEKMFPALESPVQVLCRLDPPTASYETGNNHTVTVTMKVGGLPIAAIPTRFEVVAGPNHGLMDSATTNVQGQASMTYRGEKGLGSDTIRVAAVYNDSTYLRVAQASWFPEGTLFGPLGPPIGKLKRGGEINGGISCDGYRFSESVIEAHGQVQARRVSANQLHVQIELRGGDPGVKYEVEIFEAGGGCGSSDLAATGIFLAADHAGNGRAEVSLQLPYAPPKHHPLGDGLGAEALIVVLDWVDSVKGGDRFSTDAMALPAAPAR